MRGIKRTRYRISFELLGPEELGGDLRLSDMVAQLENLKNALKQIDRSISGGESVDYKVIGLSHNSPATFELEVIKAPGASQDNRERVPRTLTRAYAEISRRGAAPRDLGSGALMALKGAAMASGVRQTRIVSNPQLGTPDVTITDAIVPKIERILGKDEYAQGSVTGALDAINIHRQQSFWIYPTISDRRAGISKIRCSFGNRLRSDATRALGQYVTVYGTLKYKVRDSEPYEVLVDEIEIHPEEGLPTLNDFKGVGSIPEGEAPDEFVRRLRGEWR